jgi:subtilase family serine protease
LRPASPTAASSSYPGSGVGGGYSPADLRSAYGLPPSESAGVGQTIAIVDAFDDPNAEADLARYRSRYGLPACTTSNGCFRKVDQTGGTHYPPPNFGWAFEISLDVDMVSAACPHCHIVLVEANDNTLGNLLQAESEATTLGATEVSNSWGGEEKAFETGDLTYVPVPTTASAGDNGRQSRMACSFAECDRGGRHSAHTSVELTSLV